jgi:acyl-CoA thioesterase I
MRKSIFRFFVVVCCLLVCISTLAQAKKKVACIGNSITQGSGIPVGKAYPDVLQQLLGDGYEVRNFGVSGRTLLKKGDFPYWNEQKYQDALQWQPDIIIMKLGTNDSKPQNWKWGSEFRQDYTELVNSFKQAANKPNIFLCYPVPVFESRWGITDSIVKNEIIPQVKKVAGKTGSKIIDLYKPFVGNSHLTYDGIHPNTEGAVFLAGEVYKHIKN